MTKKKNKNHRRAIRQKKLENVPKMEGVSTPSEMEPNNPYGIDPRIYNRYRSKIEADKAKERLFAYERFVRQRKLPLDTALEFEDFENKEMLQKMKENHPDILDRAGAFNFIYSFAKDFLSTDPRYRKSSCLSQTL